MDFELRYATAQRGEHAQNDEFAGRGRQTGPGVDVAKGPGGDLAAEIGRDVCKGIGDLLPGLAIDLLQHPQAVLVPLVAGHASPKRRGGIAERRLGHVHHDGRVVTGRGQKCGAQLDGIGDVDLRRRADNGQSACLPDPETVLLRRDLTTTQLEEASSGRSAGKR